MASKYTIGTIKTPPANEPGHQGRGTRGAIDGKGSSQAGSTPARSIGKIRPYVGIVLSTHRDCDQCEGTRVAGMWIHSARCPQTVLLWFAHGFKPQDWTSPVYRCCRFQCPGMGLPSGITHSWNCAWWDSPDNRTAEVPFGLEAPHHRKNQGATRHARRSAGGVCGTPAVTGRAGAADPD